MRRYPMLVVSLMVMVGLVGVAPAAAQEARAVTVRVLDQVGTEILGSEILFPGGLPTGSRVVLGDGTYSVTVYPGIAGRAIWTSGGLGRTAQGWLPEGTVTLPSDLPCLNEHEALKGRWAAVFMRSLSVFQAPSVMVSS